MVVATKIFWALGYNQVETFLTTLRPKQVEFDPDATLAGRPAIGRGSPRTTSTRSSSAPRATRTAPIASPRAGSFRGNSRQLSLPGTRSDDPNDLVPHEHRRELRALHVFGAWTNLTDLKAGNTLDTLVTENGRGIVTHYLQDVGSTFGMGNGPP